VGRFSSGDQQLSSDSESRMSAAVLFGKRLRAVRKAQGLRIGKLAERAETGVKHLGRIERGEKQPSFELIISLAKGLDVSPSILFDFEPAQTDPRVLKAQLQHFLERKDARQLLQAKRVLRALFDL
jgi:transcriptional regulator with XRE-family HTH domain